MCIWWVVNAGGLNAIRGLCRCYMLTDIDLWIIYFIRRPAGNVIAFSKQGGRACQGEPCVCVCVCVRMFADTIHDSPLWDRSLKQSQPIISDSC